MHPDGSMFKSVTTTLGEKTDKSVTTTLGEKTDKSSLLEWRKRVGDAEADKISNQAATRGTAVHELCEKYIMNDDNYSAGAMPSNLDSFMKIKRVLDSRITKIFGIEYPLFSHTLRAAGRTDVIAEFDGVNSIVDFKTSRKVKLEEYITNYFLQATCYAMMAEELTGMVIPKIAIIIAVDHEPTQVFVKDKSEYVERVKEIFC